MNQENLYAIQEDRIMRDNVEFVNTISLIREKHDSLSKTHRMIASYILANPGGVMTETLDALANRLEISQGSILKFCRVLGYDGYSALKLGLAQSIQPYSLQTTSKNSAGKKKYETSRELMLGIAADLNSSFKSTADLLEEGLIERAAELIMAAKHIEIYGVTSSAMLAEDTEYRLLKLGLPARATTDALRCPISALTLTSEDVVIVISCSGKTHDIVRTLELARENGASVIGITSDIDSPIARLCDVPILISSISPKVTNLTHTPRIVQMYVIEVLCQYIAGLMWDKSLEMQRQIDAIWLEYYQSRDNS